MANEQNLKPVRTKSEARERGRNGGINSGKSRRRKADFRKTLNMLLTAEIDSEEYKPILEAPGLECALESALNMAIIKEGLLKETDYKLYRWVWLGECIGIDELIYYMFSDNHRKESEAKTFKLIGIGVDYGQQNAKSIQLQGIG